MPLSFFSKCTKISVKSKCFIVTAAVILFILTHSMFQDKILIEFPNMRTVRNVKLDNIIVHIDLKGSPPKLSYLKTLLPKLQELGVTGLLIEYEDMFPYDGRLLNLSARNCYDKPKEFLTLAARVGFDVIPLIQTFGHMEFVLKLAEFQHLREESAYPDSLCPSKHASHVLVKEMLEQVIKFHQEIIPLKYLHIGCDEVSHINKCRHCLRRNLKSTDIYLNHVHRVLNIVKTISPNTTVLAWDDMFRSIPLDMWNKIHKPDIDLVYWDYTPGITSVSNVNLMKYHKTFNNIWIASAFKGADGVKATYPNLKNRFSNHFSWMKLILDYTFSGESETYNFKGIILTGWSRYSHMEPPCELLPVSIPSLYLNLLAIKQFKNEVQNVKYIDLNAFFVKYIKEDLAGNLHCSESKNFDSFDTYHCYFEGSELYQILKDWDIMEMHIFKTINSVQSSLSTIEYYSKIRKINMNSLRDCLDWYYEYINEIRHLKYRMSKFLSKYYDDSFVEEYTDFKIHNTKEILNNIAKHLTKMLLVTSGKS